MNSSSFLPLSSSSQHTAIVSIISDNQLAAGTTAAVAAGLLWYLLKSEKNKTKNIRGWPLIGHWDFFTRRHDFIQDGFKKFSSEHSFGFNILNHQVVAMRGEAARKKFFDQRELSFTEGYNLLFGGAPEVKDITDSMPEMEDKQGMSWFIRRITALLKMDRIAQLTPSLMLDIERNMENWGNSGTFDPFDIMYSIVFQLTIRTAGAKEIADSIEKCRELEQLFWLVERGSTAASILLPWFPSPARKKKVAATTDIYLMLDGIINQRKSENRREDDALQELLDVGDSTPEIIQFIMGTLFAGIVNTGLMSAWIFLFLDQEPEWKEKVIEELRVLLDKYAPLSENPGSVAERLGKVPSHIWEDEMPVLETCLRETIRLIVSGAALRRVVKGDIEVDGKMVPNGTFLVYLLGETHHDPNIYPNPSRFDPGRYAAGQDKSQTYGFLGWGVGRHPCAGRRFAQFEIKAMVAMFLVSYTYEVVDAADKKPDPSVVVPDKNNLYQARPKDQTFYVKYTKRQQQL